MNKSILWIAVLLAIIGANFAATKVDSDIQNKNVERTIDLTTQLVKIQEKITYKSNSGDSYTYVVPADKCEHLAFISVKDALKKELKTVEEKTARGSEYTVTITSASTNPILYVETVYTKDLQPFPTQITQLERQLVRYFGNAHFYSPYKTITQKTTIQLASKNVESFTAVKPSSHSDTTITYGSYENIPGLFYFPFNHFVVVLNVIFLQLSQLKILLFIMKIRHHF